MLKSIEPAKTAHHYFAIFEKQGEYNAFIETHQYVEIYKIHINFSETLCLSGLQRKLLIHKKYHLIDLYHPEV